jgi:hypothetical protein
VDEYSGAARPAVQAYLLEEQSSGDTPAAMAEFARLHADAANDKELTGAAAIIASKLSETDIASALTWAGNLQDGAAKDAALSTVASEWVDEDPGAASEWIATLPAGDVKDGAAERLANAITKRDPAAAFEWARNIQEPNKRRWTLNRVLEEWRARDPDAAGAALDSLTPDVRRGLSGQDP